MTQFKRKFQVEGEFAHQPLLVSKNYSDCPFMWYQSISSMFFRLVTKQACNGRIDGRTDRRTELRSQDRASIAAFCGKN